MENNGENGVPCEFLTGRAGTGKSFEALRRCREQPGYGTLAATTGVSAVNLGMTTINSLLSFFDTESLIDSYLTGRLLKKLRDVAALSCWLLIDEVSMLEAAQLDTLYEAVDDLNNERAVGGKPPLGLVLVGDFGQLPPVKGQFAFQARCWPKAASKITRLNKVWRQDHQQFLEALEFARRGQGTEAVRLLRSIANFADTLDLNFVGTTIMGRNVEVERYNTMRLKQLPGEEIASTSKRWGRQRGEWKHIPEKLVVKKGCYVMVLSNRPPDFEYANGDCGWVEDFDASKDTFHVKLARNGKVVKLPRIIRANESQEKPAHPNDDGTEARPVVKAGWRFWLRGEISYHPLRLAYASTCHKAQGLTLDRVQLDCRNRFFGSPNLSYVALSRARSPAYLRIVGRPEVLAARIKVAPEVVEWL